MKHIERFARFCKDEIATGGPDPQLAVMAYLARNESIASKIWMAGCYGAHHCVPSATIVWNSISLPSHDMISWKQRLTSFLEANWDSLPVRPEMRSHRMLHKRVDCLVGFANYALSWHEKKITNYDELWRDSIDSVPFYGRYMAIKFCELLRRMDVVPFGLYDMRAKHAWSPRQTLALIFDDKETAARLADRDDNSPLTVALAEACATETINLLRAHGVSNVDYFQLQVLLCEYKEALNKGYYPGASLDEEMDYIAKCDGKFNTSLGMIWEARQALFGTQYLGEDNGWEGIRKQKFAEYGAYV